MVKNGGRRIIAIVINSVQQRCQSPDLKDHN